MLHPFSGFTASICQLQVDSRGSVRIRSADPRAAPAIRYNYLATENDRRIMVDGMKLLRRIVAQPAMRRYIAAEHMPGARCRPTRSWLAYCRETGSTIYHPTCTAMIGDGARSSTAAAREGPRRACAWWTPRSCRRWSRATPTPP